MSKGSKLAIFILKALIVAGVVLIVGSFGHIDRGLLTLLEFVKQTLLGFVFIVIGSGALYLGGYDGI